MRVNLVGMPKEWVGSGDAFGYTTAFNLAKRALQLSEIEITEDAKIWIHYAPPQYIVPKEGKINIGFTMWEAERFPDEFVGFINKCDYVIVPSKHSKEVLKRSGVCRTIFVCNLAIDTDFYCYHERRVKPMDEMFRFLWVGAPNVRKGVEDAIRCFVEEFKEKGRNAELYLKSSLFGHQGQLLDWSKEYNAVMDTRTVSLEALRDLYWSADCLVYPSKGEGAGMIPMEFMATGGVVLAPPYSGMRDYINTLVAVPLKFRMIDVYYGVATHMATVDLPYLKQKMLWCYENRGRLSVLGKQAADYAKMNFNINKMRLLLSIILSTIKDKEKL